LEVMIAVAIFFVSVFSILELVSQNLRYIQNLQKPQIDIGSIAAETSTIENRDDIKESGDFGDLYPNASWSQEIYEVGSNGLFQVDITVEEAVSGNNAVSKMSILLYRPNWVDEAIGGTIIQR